MTASVLMAVPDCPVPADHGGRIDILGRLHALADMGVAVDLAIATYDEPTASQLAELRPLTRRVIWAPRTAAVHAHANARPFQVVSRQSLRRIPVSSPYDLVLLESHYVSALLDHPHLQGVPTALRVHNDEPTYFKGLAAAERTLPRRLFYRAEAARFRWLESRLREKIDFWVFLSTVEFTTFQSRYPHRQGMLLGPPWNPRPIEQRTPQLGNVLWFGSLFMVNNRHGLDWYLNEVHPALLADAHYSLTIAGNARGTDLGALRQRAAQREQRIALVESPERIEPLYENAELIVAPIFQGAGVKLKTINAFEHGVPIVTTRVGVEGTPLSSPEHLLTAESPADFASAVRDTLANPDAAQVRVRAGRRLLAEHNDPAAVLKPLLDAAVARRRAP